MLEDHSIMTGNIADLLHDLDHREVALWFHGPADSPDLEEALLPFLRLPWRMVLAERMDANLIGSLEQGQNYTDPLVRKRGFIQVIGDDPAQIELPRCLPIYLVDGHPGKALDPFERQLRHMQMLGVLRRSGVRRLLVLSLGQDVVPDDLRKIWGKEFQPLLSFASDATVRESAIVKWSESIDGRSRPIPSLLRQPLRDLIDHIVDEYGRTYPEDRIVIRLRNRSGETKPLDITGLDDPEHPLLDQYSLIQKKDLANVLPEDLPADELDEFFRDATSSWHPYAAGLPWLRERSGEEKLAKLLSALDSAGSDKNCIAYVTSEPGAGGTTFVRALAWQCARRGYPVLVAEQIPFVPNATQVANFIKRVQDEFVLKMASATDKHGVQEDRDSASAVKRRYETPWLILFDRMHWEHRDEELRRFTIELRASGRPACVLVVSGPIRGLAYFDTSLFNEVGELNHALDEEETLRLGRHLNRFLRSHGNDRPDWKWRQFYHRHTISNVDGVAAFWVVLSFWLRRQIDLEETLQQRLYRCFEKDVDRDDIRRALLEIAAMSSERMPTPQGLLPESDDDWPLQQHLEDQRSSLGALGLVRVGTGERTHWALVHDILGQLLINAVFHDPERRKSLGFDNAIDAIHLRFLLLASIAKKERLNRLDYRKIADQFATSIFKIDPGQGRATYLPYWREVLAALDGMPDSVRRASRIFNHHTAISRRRIAKFEPETTHASIDERVDLIVHAIQSIEYALNNIDRMPGDETDLNLYNSLAHAYLDQLSLQPETQIRPEEKRGLLDKASKAARRAYEIGPTNSFVIEMFVRNLLAEAAADRNATVEKCIQALGVLFAAMMSGEQLYRRMNLDGLATEVVGTLMGSRTEQHMTQRPNNAVAVLTNAWIALCADRDEAEFSLEDIPEPNILRAIDALQDDAGHGNTQVIRLLYELTAIAHPHDFRRQLESLEQLQGLNSSRLPQELLEYAILLYQTGRPGEGENVFKQLRQVWREGQHFVEVPERLHWLRDDNGRVRTVQAVVFARHGGGRPMAKVGELRNCQAPFREHEFSGHQRVGTRFQCLVSFGHNGPFLRPVTARAH